MSQFSSLSAIVDLAHSVPHENVLPFKIANNFCLAPVAAKFSGLGKLQEIAVLGFINDKAWNEFLLKHKRKVGRPKKAVLPRGGTSQTHDDEEILTILQCNGSLTIKEIAEKTCISKKTVYSWYKRFSKFGLVQVISKKPLKIYLQEDRNLLFAYDCFRAIQTKTYPITIKNLKTLIEKNPSHLKATAQYINKTGTSPENFTWNDFRKFDKEFKFVEQEKKFKTHPYSYRQALNRQLSSLKDAYCTPK